MQNVGNRQCRTCYDNNRIGNHPIRHDYRGVNTWRIRLSNLPSFFILAQKAEMIKCFHSL